MSLMDPALKSCVPAAGDISPGAGSCVFFRRAEERLHPGQVSLPEVAGYLSEAKVAAVHRELGYEADDARADEDPLLVSHPLRLPVHRLRKDFRIRLGHRAHGPHFDRLDDRRPVLFMVDFSIEIEQIGLGDRRLINVGHPSGSFRDQGHFHVDGGAQAIGSEAEDTLAVDVSL